MAKIIKVEAFECEFCGKEYKTLKGVENHEPKCPSNTIRKKIEDEGENIRLTATSPQHLISMLQDFWLKLGVKVTFTDYPSHFSLEVSNSHNSPRGYPTNWCGREDKNGIPRGYPGWKGRWEGVVEVLDSCTITKKELSFSDLTGRWSDQVTNIWYIQTGTGGGGTSFSYTGMLWLYDFPKMHEEFEKNGGRLNVLKNEHVSLLDRYKNTYEKAKTHSIQQNKIMQQCQSYKTVLQELSNKLVEATKTLNEHLTYEFNKHYGVKMPEVCSAFSVDQDFIKHIYLGTGMQKTVVHPDLKALFTKIKESTADINEYVEKYPEFLF